MRGQQSDREWAREAAVHITGAFSDSAAFETADYQLCSFIMAAARITLQDDNCAERIGSFMERPREDVERFC
jgi:hypothetical protein